MSVAPDGIATPDRPGAAGAPLGDSIATAEFAAALDRIARLDLDDRRRPLPLRYRAPVAGGEGGAGHRRWDAGVPTAPTAAGRGPIGDALAALETGSTTCAGLLDQALAAVDRHDGDLHAVVALLDDDARRDAAALDAALAAGDPLRPLHGIPITVKDVIDVAGAPTRCGSDAYLDHPAVDAAGIARLRAAGAVVLAKVSTHEFALGVTNPQSRNPHDPTRIPGGSSGGSAIAVATGMGLGSIGTDTRASIRVPASLSGVVGFKATFGRVPTTGVVSLAWSMDHLAPMASTVDDTARLLAVLLADASVLPTTGDPDADLAARVGAGALTVGVPEAAFVGADPEVEAAVRAVLDGLAGRGHRARPAPVPTLDDLHDANALGLVISRTEAASFHRGIGTDLDRCWTEIADQLRAAARTPAIDYLTAQRLRAALADRLLGAFATADVLALPTTPVTAPPVDAFAEYLMVLSRNAIPWSLVGFPAVSIPCGRSSAGLPIGFQLVAPPGQDALLVDAARVVESVVAERTGPGRDGTAP